MGIEETKHDLYLKRVQLTIAILGGLLAVAVGAYNAKKTFFPGGTAPGDIAASVRADSGQPLSGVSVQIYDSGNAMVASGTTNGSGEFSKKLAAGNYIFKAARQGYDPEVVTIRVDSGETSDFQVKLRALSGAPAPQSGNPIKAALEEAGASWIKKSLVKTSDEKTNG